MGKIATWKWLGEEMEIMYPVTIVKEKCPIYSDLSDNSMLVISGDYEDNQCIQESDISKPVSYTVTVNLQLASRTGTSTRYDACYIRDTSYYWFKGSSSIQHNFGRSNPPRLPMAMDTASFTVRGGNFIQMTVYAAARTTGTEAYRMILNPIDPVTEYETIVESGTIYRGWTINSNKTIIFEIDN